LITALLAQVQAQAEQIALLRAARRLLGNAQE
jgi:hypothetical protein